MKHMHTLLELCFELIAGELDGKHRDVHFILFDCLFLLQGLQMCCVVATHCAICVAVSLKLEKVY